MSASTTENPIQVNEADASLNPTCMTSVNRFAKLPVVESTIQTAQQIYEKVKDYNSVTNWTLQTAENTAFKAVDIAKPYTDPVMKNLEGPIKKVDDALCTGLDYVETKVPAVKLPTKEIYESTKGLVSPAVESAKKFVEPAVQTAKDVLEPAVTRTRNIVEPMVEPFVENVKQRVDDYLHRNEDAPEGQETDHNHSSYSESSSGKN